MKTCPGYSGNSTTLCCVLFLVEIVVGVAGQGSRGEEELLVSAIEERLHWWNCSCLQRWREVELKTHRVKKPPSIHQKTSLCWHLHCDRSLPARRSLGNIKTRFVCNRCGTFFVMVILR